MKTLKKTLCLVLAFVMALSLCSVASAVNVEKYDDAAEVGAAYKEAVEVLLGLGIVNGVSATELSPEGYYTRAQAAKIATYLAVGPTVAEMLPAGESFTDVPASHWASKYISYCAEKGILNGVTATEYQPEAYVTGYQFAKMVLAAAGYGQNNEFVGSGWAIATAQWALDVDNNLFDGDAKAATNEPITRQQAMLIAFNALKNVEFQKYSKDEGTYTDIVANESIGETKYAMNDSAEGLVNENASNNVLYAKKTQIGANDYAVVTGADLVKHWVRVYTTGTGTSLKTVAVVDLSTVVEVSKAIATEAAWDAAFGTEDITDAASVPGLTNGSVAPIGTYILYNKEIKAYIAPAANDQVVAKVTAYTAPTASATGSVTITGLTADGAIGTTAAITLQKVGSTTADKVALYDGIKVNDYVYVTKVGTTAAVVEKATVVTAAFEGRASDNSKVTIGGTSYDVATVGTEYFVTANNTAIGDLGLTAVSSATLGTATYNIVMTSDGDVLGYYDYTPVSAANDYAVVQAVNVTVASGSAGDWATEGNFKAATAKVKLALADGTSAIYSYQLTTAQSKMDDADDIKAALGLTSIAAGDVVKYAAANGIVTELVEATTVSATAVAKGSTLLAGQAGKYLTADTVLIYWDTADTTDWEITRFVGYNSLKSATATVKVVLDTTGTKAVFAYVPVAGTTSTSTTLKAYVPSMAYTVRYDSTLATPANVYDYTLYVDGVKTVLTATAPIVAGGSAAAPYIATYTVTDGYLSAVTYIAAGAAKDTYVDQQIAYVTADVLVANGVEYTYDNAKVYNVATDGTITEGTVAVSTADYNTVLVLAAAADGTTVADIAYIYNYKLS